MSSVQKITPFLWFDHQAEEAVNLYISLFENSGIDTISRVGADEPEGKGVAQMITFHLAGQPFMALNGGPMAAFSSAISFFVNCETQAEVDRLWKSLLEGGEAQQCGWLVDKFGITWQIVPTILGELMSDPDPVKVSRVTQAMLKMVKLDGEALRRAYAQG